MAVRCNFIRFFKGPGGCGEVLRIALPLVLSTGALTIQMFIDRVFLMWYASETMSAAMHSGLVNYTIFSLFLGTAMYVNTFVAQYDGAGVPKRVGASVWQGIYFSIIAGLLMIAIAPLAETVMNWSGHDPIVRKHEVIYFRILCFGAMPGLITATLACFYTGRGKTWTVMWVNIASTTVNIVLDYGLIFGNWHLPRWGIAGAAWATVCASVLSTVIYFILFLRQRSHKDYATLGGWRLDKELFIRLMRFGLPCGVQFMLDVFGFALFVTFIGRINPLSLVATSMAFQINSLAFTPMFGFNMAVSTLVGRSLGKGRPDLAQRSTWSAACVTMCYMTIIAAGYWFIPDLFMYPFALQANPAEFALVKPVVVRLLCFVAFYCLFDTGNLIFSGALKGAGDTRFVMIVSVVLNWLLMVVPSYFVIKLTKETTGLYLAWLALTVYVCTLSIVFLFRFLSGKWKRMRVIEAVPHAIPPNMPPVPTVETELTDK